MDWVVHRDHGVLRVLSTGEDGGERILELKQDTPRETYHRVPVHDVRIYDERMWSDPRQAIAKAKLYENGKWHKACRKLRLLNCPQLTYVLEFLINWQQTRGRRREWFYCTDHTIVLHAYVTPRSVTECMVRLRKRGFVECKFTSRSQGGRQRWIRINYRTIWQEVRTLLEDWQAKYRKPEQPDR